MMKFDMRIHYKILIIASICILPGLESAVADSEGDILARIRPLGRINVSPPVAPIAQSVVAVSAAKIEPAPKTEPASQVSPKPESKSMPVPATKSTADASVILAGKKVYDGICFACHGTGVANAPKIGNKAAWAPLIAKGEAALVRSTIDGTAKGMPSRGTCDTCSDEDLKIAVEYMVHMGTQ